MRSKTLTDGHRVHEPYSRHRRGGENLHSLDTRSDDLLVLSDSVVAVRDLECDIGSAPTYLGCKRHYQSGGTPRTW